MTERIYLPYDELVDMVIEQLKMQHYMESTLQIYERIYCKIGKYLKQLELENYAVEVGQTFLDSQTIASSTMSTYKCAVRRLNDYLNGKEYRCHHENDVEKICDQYQELLERYICACIRNGNKPGTIKCKRTSCITFLNQLAQNGYEDISRIDAGIIAKLLLSFENKDRYADIRLFLRYLYENAMIKRDYSEIIPRVKRTIPIPTVYDIDEIKRFESSIDISTDTGIRNIAIIRLATRMGLRSGDIAKLKINELDFSSGYINIIQEKTGSPLELQMPTDVYDSIYLHLENSKKKQYLDNYVFHSMTAPYGQLTTTIIRHVVNEHMKLAGIEINGRKHGPHAFRSSLASSMIKDDTSYETVRKILGHSDPDVIKHYAKTDIEKLRLCSLEPPNPSGLFKEYLSGKKVFNHV